MTLAIVQNLWYNTNNRKGGVCHMGKYVDPGNEAFQRVVRTGKYVDKSGMIEFTNNIIHDFRPLICFSRPRRFGKSIAAHMLAAYYSKGCDSREIFSGLKLAGLPTMGLSVP